MIKACLFISHRKKKRNRFVLHKHLDCVRKNPESVVNGKWPQKNFQTVCQNVNIHSLFNPQIAFYVRPATHCKVRNFFSRWFIVFTHSEWNTLQHNLLYLFTCLVTIIIKWPLLSKITHSSHCIVSNFVWI